VAVHRGAAKGDRVGDLLQRVLVTRERLAGDAELDLGDNRASVTVGRRQG
jgi:hypothetical protein